MEKKLMDMGAFQNCQNLEESYGEICVKCNKCGRFDAEKQTENEELFGILSDTINGANYDDLNEAVYKILGIANYHKQSKGKWITPTTIGGRAFNIPHCSVCGGVPCGVDENTRYCPNCGSKMKGGEDIC